MQWNTDPAATATNAAVALHRNREGRSVCRREVLASRSTANKSADACGNRMRALVIRPFPRRSGARRSMLLENERAVRAAETERVLQRHVNLHFPRFVRAVIQVALRVLVEDVHGGRRDLMVQRQDGKDCFQSAGAPKKMARH